eukprot:6218520-Pyramimonas_sp.AAC.1
MSVSAEALQRFGVADTSAATTVTARECPVASNLEHLARSVFNLNSATAIQVGRGLECIAAEDCRD